MITLFQIYIWVLLLQFHAFLMAPKQPYQMTHFENIKDIASIIVYWMYA